MKCYSIFGWFISGVYTFLTSKVLQRSLVSNPVSFLFEVEKGAGPHKHSGGFRKGQSGPETTGPLWRT